MASAMYGDIKRRDRGSLFIRWVWAGGAGAVTVVGRARRHEQETPALLAYRPACLPMSWLSPASALLPATCCRPQEGLFGLREWADQGLLALPAAAPQQHAPLPLQYGAAPCHGIGSSFSSGGRTHTVADGGFASSGPAPDTTGSMGGGSCATIPLAAAGLGGSTAVAAPARHHSRGRPKKARHSAPSGGSQESSRDGDWSESSAARSGPDQDSEAEEPVRLPRSLHCHHPCQRCPSLPSCRMCSSPGTDSALRLGSLLRRRPASTRCARAQRGTRLARRRRQQQLRTPCSRPAGRASLLPHCRRSPCPCSNSPICAPRAPRGALAAAPAAPVAPAAPAAAVPACCRRRCTPCFRARRPLFAPHPAQVHNRPHPALLDIPE